MTRIPRMAACLAALTMTGCPDTNQPAAEPTGHLYLALGDSYTIGEGVDPSERWPVQLAGMLEESAVQMEEPTIIAKTGWTTDELAAAIEASDVEGRFDFVTLMVGVNDQYRGKTTPEQYREKFVAVLKKAIAFAGDEPSRVIVVSIPDYGVTPYAKENGKDPAEVARAIDEFNAVNREEAEKAGTQYLDVTRLSRQSGTEADMLVEDGLHPSGKMYEQWAKAAVGVAKRAMGEVPIGG